LLFEFNRSVDAIRRKKVGCSRPGGTDYGATLQYMLAVALLCAGWSIPDARAQMNPPSFELMEATIPQLQWALSAGIVTSHDLVAQYLARPATSTGRSSTRLASQMAMLSPRQMHVMQSAGRVRAAGR
jgi:hypothetical protein